MKLSMPLVYAGNPRETADQVAGLEKAGLDRVWVAEPYGFDSPTLICLLYTSPSPRDISGSRMPSSA